MSRDRSLDQLLEPSLSSETAPRPLYSVRAGFFVAFFGGMFAAVLFGYLNARRARTVEKDWPLLLALLGAAVAVTIWIGSSIGHLPGWFPRVGNEQQTLRLFNRLLGLLMYGAVHLRHRLLHNVNELRGTKPLSPWAAGIGCIVVGGVLNFVILLGARSP